MINEPTVLDFPSPLHYWKWRAEVAERDAANKQKVIDELRAERPSARGADRG
jgi:hypothetical protein